MATLKPGKAQGTWKAYFYDRATKKQVWVPADVCRAWDGLERLEAERCLEEWLGANGIQRVRARRRAVFSSDAVSVRIQAFIDERRALSDVGASTLRTVDTHLKTYVLDYFVREHGTKDVRQWWRHTAGFTQWLRTKHPDLTVETVKKICQNLRRFGEYLAIHHEIPQPWLIPLPKRRRGARQTPLPRAVKPDEALKVAGKLKGKWALCVLLGYFASLRPEEVYGLTKEDFITGTRAKRDAKTHRRLTDKGLGSGLSIAINKTRTRDNGQKDLVKSHYSFGVVNVWSLEAAKRVAKLVERMPRGFLFGKADRSKLDKEYAETVKPLLGMFLYDLRRASGLYLGREVGLDPFLLQDHLRHSSMTTTLLYTRRPHEEQETADTQDFSDVS